MVWCLILISAVQVLNLVLSRIVVYVVWGGLVVCWLACGLRLLQDRALGIGVL